MVVESRSVQAVVNVYIYISVVCAYTVGTRIAK